MYINVPITDPNSLIAVGLQYLFFFQRRSAHHLSCTAIVSSGNVSRAVAIWRADLSARTCLVLAFQAASVRMARYGMETSVWSPMNAATVSINTQSLCTPFSLCSIIVIPTSESAKAETESYCSVLKGSDRGVLLSGFLDFWIICCSVWVFQTNLFLSSDEMVLWCFPGLVS
jgi:hypothetical protein